MRETGVHVQALRTHGNRHGRGGSVECPLLFSGLALPTDWSSVPLLFVACVQVYLLWDQTHHVLDG
jgi:hypothetical protein